MTAVYNEIEPYAAQWLRNLIAAGHVAPGDVDTRSIRDVEPADWLGYDQVHCFAGIGIWSLALRMAGWPDDRPIWTGSCPCQPFSAAGKGAGFDDDRHLWPEWFRLIRLHRPDVVVGEQVASKDGLNWFDLVSSDLEGADYAVGASDLCVAGFGGPHIRQRLWFMAHAMSAGRAEGWPRPGFRPPASSSSTGGMADDDRQGRGVEPERDSGSNAGCGAPRGGDTDGRRVLEYAASQQEGLPRRPREPGGASTGVLADDDDERRHGSRIGAEPSGRGLAADLGVVGDHHHQGSQVGQVDPEFGRPLRLEGATLGAADPLRGRWAGADWIWCRDGKYRPVEPATFPLAHGYPSRVGRLRAYGNAISPEVAAAFLEAAMECLP